MRQKLLDLIDEVYPESVKLRRYLHENPELSSQEYKTSQFLKKYSQKLGLEVEALEPTDNSVGTGFIATLDTGKTGKTVGLRTDIDALPINETKNNLAQERITISKNNEVMHACGHDGHMATILGAMNILVLLKEELSGKIIFIFEEGEENNTGVHPMVELLKTKNVDAIYGNHLVSFLPTGKISASPGPVTSSTARVLFDVIGKGGHASRPDKSINPVFAASYILTSLANAWNNQLDVEETITLGITQFVADGARNVIPEKVHIGGTLRYFDKQIGEDASEVIRHVATHVAAAHNCSVEFSPDFGPSTPSVVNDVALSSLTEELIEELYPGVLEKNVKWYAAETFSRYAEVSPTVFSFVGMSNEDAGSGAEHHNPYFDIDEEAMKYAIGTMTGFALKFLNEK
jgi:amidohydrolase